MSDIHEIASVNWPLFIALILPGFVSMRVYAMIRPVEHSPLKDTLLEAISLSILNAAMLWWAIVELLQSDNVYFQYALIVFIFIVAPVFWPFLIGKIIDYAALKGLILSPAKTAWDQFFLRREPCWIIVSLSDGRRIGGYFGEMSYATLHPQSGHIYIEELWEVDQTTGEIGDAVPASKGLLLRPGDYQFIELKALTVN